MKILSGEPKTGGGFPSPWDALIAEVSLKSSLVCWLAPSLSLCPVPPQFGIGCELSGDIKLSSYSDWDLQTEELSLCVARSQNKNSHLRDPSTSPHQLQANRPFLKHSRTRRGSCQTLLSDVAFSLRQPQGERIHFSATAEVHPCRGTHSGRGWDRKSASFLQIALRGLTALGRIWALP